MRTRAEPMILPRGTPARTEGCGLQRARTACMAGCEDGEKLEQRELEK